MTENSIPAAPKMPAATTHPAGGRSPKKQAARDRRNASPPPPAAATPPAEAAPPRPGSLAERSARVARAIAGVRRIRLPEPRQLAVMAELDEVRLTGVEMRGMPMLGMTLFEITGAGKTTVAEQYAARRNAGATGDDKPVLHVRLDNAGTARSLYVDILTALGDGFGTSGTEQNLRHRALDALGDAATELVIIDESHHGGKRSGFGGAITSSVKLMLDGGVVPVALLGTELAVPIFAKDFELSGRLTAPCHLGALVWYDEYDRAIWKGFLAALEERLVADGIVAGTFGMTGDDVALPLMEATNGVLGQLMGTMRTAVRETVRAGRDVVSFEDVVHAVDVWNVGHGFVDRNPLRDI